MRRGTLATVDEAGRTFPAIPGVTFPTRVNGLDALGFGPTFARTRAERVTNADESVARRILLPEDAEVLIRMAEESDVLR